MVNGHQVEVHLVGEAAEAGDGPSVLVVLVGVVALERHPHVPDPQLGTGREVLDPGVPSCGEGRVACFELMADSQGRPGLFAKPGL